MGFDNLVFGTRCLQHSHTEGWDTENGKIIIIILPGKIGNECAELWIIKNLRERKECVAVGRFVRDWRGIEYK